MRVGRGGKGIRPQNIKYDWMLIDLNTSQPVAVFPTIDGLAAYCGVSVNDIQAAICHEKQRNAKSGTDYHCKYEKVRRPYVPAELQRRDLTYVCRCCNCDEWQNNPGHPLGYCQMLDYFTSMDDYCSMGSYDLGMRDEE